MIRIILIVVLAVVGGLAYAWYSSQTLPDWYQAPVHTSSSAPAAQSNAQQSTRTYQQTPQSRAVEQLTDTINKQGIGAFLGSKFAGVMRGQLELSETEFNALMIASLQADPDGRKLLSVSDALNAQIRQGELELGVILDLNKVAQLDKRAHEAVAQVRDALPFLDQSKMAIAVTGQPVARNGEIGFTDDFTVTIGSIPLSSSLLSQLGVPVHKARSASLELKYLTVNSVTLAPQAIQLGVLPRF
ncbi:MAG: hypothetical protein HKN50_01075 [Gammaproteobacteria bacterium]|nr:hypothetical protein [Gammaproteobacteria bacterium]